MQLFIARCGYRAINNAASHDDELQSLANIGNTYVPVHPTVSLLLLELLAD
jgi:hypothetical protein